MLRTAMVENAPARTDSCLWERILGHRLAPLVISGFALIGLLFWSVNDHSMPVHDAAWHSSISDAFRRWLAKPSSWSIDTLLPLLTTQPLYPAGVWFTNGCLKLIFGDSKFAESLILACYLLILNFSVWSISMQLFKDRQKAALSLIAINTFPLILALSHVSYLDLPHTATCSLYLCALTWWWESKTFSRALTCAFCFGLALASKQIAVLYCAPILLVLACLLIRRRQLKEFMQIVVIGAVGAIFLAIWIVPNLNAILSFSQDRVGHHGLNNVGFLKGLSRNLGMVSYQIVQSISPLITAILATVLPFVSKEDVRKSWFVNAALIFGLFIVIVSSFWAIPEPRYFAPSLIAVSLLLGCGLGNLARRFKRTGTVLIAIFTLSALFQSFFICSQKSPILREATVRTENPVYAVLGLNEKFLVHSLPYRAAGDPWKQEWMFEFIEEKELGRPVFLNILMNSIEFNQGTLVCLARSRRSHVYVTTWRVSQADLTDSFDYDDNLLNSMQWVAYKTGDSGAKLSDEKSRRKLAELLEKLRNSGSFLEAARQSLPDGSSLILYRNKNWIWNFPRTRVGQI